MTKTKPYYFACSYPLEVGSVVLPGNWGRIISMYNTNGFGNAWVQYREDVFEKVRRKKFPDKPDRLESIFLCETKDDLSGFIAANNRGLDILYEVELLDNNKPIHKGCLQYLDFNQQENYASFESKAIEYWKAENVQSGEIVTTSRVRITASL